MIKNNQDIIYKYLIDCLKLPIQLPNNMLVQKIITRIVKRYIKGNEIKVIKLLLFCSRLLIKMNKLNDARYICQEILEKENINIREKIIASGLLGDIFYKAGKIDMAINYNEKALSLALKTKNYDLASIAYHQAGIILLRKRKQKLAIERFEKSIKLCKKMKKMYKLGESYYQLGKIYEREREWNLALEAYYRAILFKRKEEDDEHYDPTDIFCRIDMIKNKLNVVEKPAIKFTKSIYQK